MGLTIGGAKEQNPYSKTALITPAQSSSMILANLMQAKLLLSALSTMVSKPASSNHNNCDYHIDISFLIFPAIQ